MSDWEPVHHSEADNQPSEKPDDVMKVIQRLAEAVEANTQATLKVLQHLTKKDDIPTNQE